MKLAFTTADRLRASIAPLPTEHAQNLIVTLSCRAEEHRRRARELSRRGDFRRAAEYAIEADECMRIVALVCEMRDRPRLAVVDVVGEVAPTPAKCGGQYVIDDQHVSCVLDGGHRGSCVDDEGCWNGEHVFVRKAKP